jgi:hypothetical protein
MTGLHCWPGGKHRRVAPAAHTGGVQERVQRACTQGRRVTCVHKCARGGECESMCIGTRGWAAMCNLLTTHGCDRGVPLMPQPGAYSNQPSGCLAGGQQQQQQQQRSSYQGQGHAPGGSYQGQDARQYRY